MLRFLCPIQSWMQLVSVAASYAFFVPLVGLGVHLALPEEPLGYILTVGALTGTYPLFANLPARLELTTRTEARYFVADLSSQLRRFGYGEPLRDGARLHFVPTPPRWLRWIESELYLVVRDHAIELTGPTFVLHKLKRRCEREAQQR